MIWTGLVIGFIGSLHCIGMCGPIVMVLPNTTELQFRFFLGRISYNIGRAIAYAALGAVIGVIGQSVTLAGYQQVMGIFAGAFMIITIVIPAAMVQKFLPSNGLRKLNLFVKERLGLLLSRATEKSLFLIGVLNGFLPCGLVYSALAASLIMGSVVSSSMYMFLFGLGTLPTMLASAYVVQLLTANLRHRVARFLPICVVLMGVFFILRSLSLGIPFLSPNVEKMHSRMHGKKMEVRISDHPPCCR